jgi:hypothetical protein
MKREVIVPLKALAACAIGGAACQFLRTPLPWMIGPLLAMAMLKFSGLHLAAPRGGRELGQLVIGTALGLYFTPQVAHEVLGNWYLLIAALYADCGFVHPARDRIGSAVRMAVGTPGRTGDSDHGARHSAPAESPRCALQPRCCSWVCRWLQRRTLPGY